MGCLKSGGEPYELKGNGCLVDGLIATNQVTIVAGEPSAGKTWLGMILGHDLSRGVPFLGRQVTPRKNILYLDRENPHNVISERMTAIYGEESEEHYEQWGLWLPDEPPPLDSVVYQEYAAAGYVLIFDSFTRFHNSDENDPSEMRLVMAQIRRLQSLGAGAVILLHHRDKALKSGYRGTAEISAGADTIYSLSVEKNLRTLKLIKSRSGLDDDITFTVDWEVPSMTASENPSVARRREHYALISALLHDHSEGMRQVEIIDEMEKRKVSRAQTLRCLDAQDNQLWTSEGKGKGAPKIYREKVEERIERIVIG
jgi:hypothetical protein